MTPTTPQQPPQSSREKLVRRAKLALALERMTPAAALAAAPVAGLATLGLFNVFSVVPQWVHAALFLAAFAGAAAFGWRLRPRPLRPTRADALKRIEADGAVRHEAAQAAEDEAFRGDGALFDAHRAAMDIAARKARLGRLRAGLDRIDPHGARFAALALVAIGLIAAGPQSPQRLAHAFTPWAGEPASALADVWIEPPAYTGKAPVYLQRAGALATPHNGAVEISEGARAVAQLRGTGKLALSIRGATGTERAALSGGGRRAELLISSGGALRLVAAGRRTRWQVSVIEDRDPKVAFLETPARGRDGRLNVAARTDDDYGVARAGLRLRLDPDQTRPLDAPALEQDALDRVRTIDLAGLAGPARAAGTSVDADADPWAGLAVIATLVVVDAAGQTGESAPERFVLPRREFFNPLARAVIEQRETLSVAPGQWRRAEWALSGLTLGPQAFYERPSDYLVVRTAMWRVGKRRGEATDATVEEFWPLALQLENETLELARQRLESARDALREALENGADDATIERLAEAMREALNQYLQAMAESGGAPSPDAPPADEEVAAADLDAMLDDVRDLAKSGARGAAAQALSDLEEILDNLRMSGAGGGDGGEPGEGGAAGEAGDLIGRQRELANRAFEEGAARNPEGDALAGEEGALGGDLADLIARLDEEAREAGAAAGQPRPGAPRSLGQALADMRRAEKSLSENEFDSAGAAMERAIENLRAAAGELAERQRQQAREAQGAGAPGRRDPLGRPIGETGEAEVDIPEIADAQRARELLEELRRRLARGERTQDEIDYLERLLERF